MKISRLLCYAELIIKLSDAKLDEFIKSWYAPNKTEERKHLEKMDAYREMLLVTLDTYLKEYHDNS